jgi:DUF1680 family protein
MIKTKMLSNISKPPLHQVKIKDAFWGYYINLIREVVVPYQWEALNDRVENAERSGAVNNFKIAAGLAEGEFYGMVFQDSDVAKWLEAVAYLLHVQPNPKLEKIADEMIDVVALAQHEDGYLNTYYTLKEPQGRWSNLEECHELYCAGHMIEAGVAYYRATGKRKLLDVMSRFADYIDTVFGSEAGRLKGYDGHQEIELALVKLYEVTGNERYLLLSQYFLSERGQSPSFYAKQLEQRGGQRHFYSDHTSIDLAYSQSHKPVVEQDTAIGHAVRLVYMLTGMIDVANLTGDEKLLEAAKRLWRNIVHRQMYITGGIGSMVHGEAFSYDYDLPNDTVYAETCASIGLIFAAQRMLMIEPKAEYGDVLERALYNTVVAGMSRDGKHFFYVNPLEVNPCSCGGANHNYDHVKPIRQEWFGCACCPPNVARLLSSLGEYIYTVQEDIIYQHLYIGGEANLVLGETPVSLTLNSNYPWQGDISLTVTPQHACVFTLALRIPQWCNQIIITVNGEEITQDQLTIVAGYAQITRQWKQGDQVTLKLDMPVMRIHSHPHVRGNIGKVAIQRGPFVYCLEQVDNGAHLHEIVLPQDAELTSHHEEQLLGGVTVIEGKGYRIKEEVWSGRLYSDEPLPELTETPLKFIPYYAWANRGENEMSVWVREK